MPAVQSSDVVEADCESSLVTIAVAAPLRFRHLPFGAVTSRGGEAVELASAAGLLLDEAQQQVLHGGLGVRADGSWAAFEVAVVAPRQNLKSSTFQARLLLALRLGRSRVHVAPGGFGAGDLPGPGRACRGLARACPLVGRVSYANGKEALALKNGGRVVFGTRSSRTGRGFSLDLLILDEGHILPEHAHSALLPATSARSRPPQVWHGGSAVDETVNEHGLVLARLRERGIKQEGDRLAYFEWSAGLYDDEGNELRPNR